MDLYTAIPPDWLKAKGLISSVQTTSLDEIKHLNSQGYNVYFYPNSPSIVPEHFVKSKDIDVFQCVFVDMDEKSSKHTKSSFVESVFGFELCPTKLVNTGNGIHAYWRIADLDAMSFLRLSRRLMRLFHTDEAVCKIKQLMRLPESMNTKNEHEWKVCELIYENETATYTCETFDSVLPPISLEDEQYCQNHYNKSYAIAATDTKIQDKLPDKFGLLLRNSKEANEIWKGNVTDRSTADFRLGHLMYASGFTKDEARSVLVNSQKALSRAPVHRFNYANDIVEKIWTYETIPASKQSLSKSVKDILNSPPEVLEGTKFSCWPYLDGTECGFRLGHVVGLIAGVGVGKTSVALNAFLGFVTMNPNYVHFFVSLEQPPEEIAKRWRKMCAGDTSLYDKVHIIGNYNEDGSFRHLSLDEIKDYILDFQKQSRQKVGCVVIDHIGILKMKDKNGENQRIMDICHQLKAFALETNTLFIIQSQVPREKAGIGDLEINKDGAYGSMMFESYMDFLISCWQPLKRCYNEGAPFVTAYKFCKIRHKNAARDRIKEDTCYRMIYDTDTEILRPLNQFEDEAFKHYLKKATDKRKLDRKTELVEYVSLGDNSGTESNKK